jgi:DNA (cytosine-5)-methyltransferase 1
MAAYYNEIDRFAAQWLRELIVAGHIADGVVDERSIEDVKPEELSQYTQCHFFAGIGVWSYALRSAGWGDDRPVWTGSCPCQPFSSAGKRKGDADKRHLWPPFQWLIGQCRPGIVIGEQVANRPGEAWFDVVSTDMEGEGYACGAVVFPACSVGAPHMRKRLYWVAHATSERREKERGYCDHPEKRNTGDREVGCMADPNEARLCRKNKAARSPGRKAAAARYSQCGRPGPTNGYWQTIDWLGCRDGKWRAAEPDTFPLANGASARVGRLRGYGNAIVAPQAKAFIEAVMAHIEER